MALLVGTSGWQYAHWRGAVYPEGLAQRQELAWYAERYVVVEVNATFYRLPETSTFERWAASVPEDFVFALKASRYLTHVKRLKDPDEPVALLLERAKPLGARLGPVLVQLPPNLPRDLERLERALAAFPADVRVAFEPRHASWFEGDGLWKVLEERNAALCLADRGSRWITPVRRTADFGYVRFHGGAAGPGYGRTALASRVRALARAYGAARDVYAFFNNDTDAMAPRDARTFARLAGKAGLRPTRVAETLPGRA